MNSLRKGSGCSVGRKLILYTGIQKTGEEQKKEFFHSFSTVLRNADGIGIPGLWTKCGNVENVETPYFSTG